MAKRAHIFTEGDLSLAFKVAKANGARAFKYEAPGGHKLTFDLSDVPSDSMQDQSNPYDVPHG
ncbi:MAG TPA: hypothetical protein DIU09_09545 [Hyphomonadaceae bacterium]|nr:hypothetical protein AEM38_08205 [Hyphomonadaceae bacterium UKL13-1]HCP64817.1 hypothetical protein [Hyphomonadaceae bacterium]